MKSTTGVWLKGLGAGAMRLRQRAYCSVRALRGSLQVPAAPVGKRTLERLEPRILLSADPLSSSLDSLVNDDHDSRQQLDSFASIEQLADNLVTDFNSAADFNPANDDGRDSGRPQNTALDLSQLNELLAAQPLADVAEQRQEIIFVDTATPDYQTLIDGIVSSSATDYQIIAIDRSSDGIAIISDYLNGAENIDAVHLVSHGKAGGVQLGNTWLDQASLGEFADLIASWSTGLNSDADLLIYGCNLAADASGQDLLQALAELTGADVAASDDLTGATELGGDWELEFQLGSIQTDIPFSLGAQLSWSGVLSGSAQYADSFSSVAYSNSDGLLDWSGNPWVESGDDGNASSGRIQIVNFGGDEVLRIEGGGISDHEIERSVDHPVYANGSLELEFSYQRQGMTDATDWVRLQTSADGVSWNTVYQFDNTGGGNDPGLTQLEFDISNYASRTTYFRFISSAFMDVGSYLYIDDFEVEFNDNTLWLSTESDVVASGVPGQNSWSDSDILNFAPDIGGLGTTTSGTVGWVMDLDGFLSLPAVNVDALHYVGADLSLGSGASTVDLQAGDVLFSLDGSDLLSSSNSLFANAYDVVRFRPDSVGDYSAGEFELVFSQPDLADIIGLSLVEQDTTVGDVLLNQGSFIVAIDKSIFWNTMGDISADATDVTSQMLVDGKEDFGFGKLFSDKLDGLELIESATVVGGVSLNAGDILASTKGSNGVNLDINSQAGTSHDIYALSLTKTILGSGTTSGTVALFFDGTDINLDVSGENIDAITLYNSAAANNLPTGSVTITGTALEDQTLSVDTSSLADADGLGTFNYQWLRDGSPISGADSSTYALDDADVGALMSVEVSYTDGGGTAELVTSAETVAVVNVNDAPTFTTTALTPSYTAGGAAVSLFSGTAIDTIESGDTISGFVLTVSNVSDTTEYLAIDGLDIALSNGNSGTTTTNSLGYSVSVTGTTATVTISGGAMTSTTAEGVFNAITYRNSSSELSFGSRSVTVVSITDSGGTANGGVETSSPGLTAKVIMPTHYADYFSSVAYDNSDGSIDWSSSPWVESGDDGSVGSGAIKVTTLGADDVLQIGGGAGSVQLERVITHTSDANGSLELKFNYQRDNFSDGDDKVYLEISADGVSWSTAHTFDNSGGGSDASPTTLDFSITNYASRTTWFRFNTDAGLDAGAALYIDDFEVGYNANTLWLSTAHNVPSPSGTTGLDSWNDSDVINFDPSANGLGADSGGNFGWAFDIDNFSASNNADISALHYVTADISVGAGTPINLLEGDVLLSLWSSDTLTSSNSLAVGIDDVVRFRPDVAGDYSAGTFELLFSHPGNWGISGISLVEADTTVADVELQKGTFLITDLSGGKRYDIQVYTPGDLSVDPHDGTLQTLINGKDSPVPSKWLFEDGPLGLELLEVGYTIGGQTFNEGTILVATDGNVGVYLDNTVVGTSQDIYALNMTQTTLGSGNNAGAVSLFLDGSDVGLDTWAEGIDAFSFYHSQVATNSLPSGNVVVTGTVMEDQTLSADTSGLADADGLGSFTYQWQRDGSDISGATASTYVLDDADVGATMTVAVRYTDAGGTIEDVTSAATVAVVNVNDAPTFTTNALSPTYTEGGAAVNLFSSTDIDAVESGDTISGFVLTVANVNDFLEIINVDGIDITLTNGTSGSTGVNGLTFNVSVVGSTATLTISGGAMTSTAAENVFNAITYRNTNNDPTTGNRTVTVSSVTDSGGTANGGVDTATPGLAATVTVAAANDRPTANAVAVNADEDGTTVSGSFSVSDVDSGDSHTFDITSAPAEGSVINNNDGTFTFDPGTDFQDLADGETRDVTFNYTATDNSGAANDTSTAATVTVTVTGTNDQPVAGAVAINADEDGATVDGSFVLASDADSSDSHTFDITSTPSEGSVVNNGDGTFTFDPGTDFQDLAEGETRNVTFNYTVVDDSGTGNATSTTAIVTVTVTGSNDRPTASAVAINADEDGATVNGAFVLGSDADIADSHTFAITSSPAEGSVINNNDGTFTFDPGSDFQDLAEGETRDVTFNYTVTDDSGESNDTSVAATVTVTVTGTNDRPTASVIGAGVLSSGATVTDSFLVADSDSNDTHTFAITSSPIEGSVINNNDGTFTFDPGTDFLDLAAGATRDATFTYNATDNSGTANATSTSTVITITVSGVGGNAQPIANAVAIAAVEDSVTVTDNFSVSDADVGDSHTFTITSSPSEGSVINNNDGSFTFDPGSDFQDLAKGETRIVTFDYIAIDNSGWVNDTSTTATVSVTVTGTNDQPTADAVAISADEDGATVDGTFVVAGDADTTDSHTFAITSAPTEGSVVNNNDGTFTFDPGTDFQDLADGETRDVTFTYTAIDDSSTGNATSASATVTITVTGTNDQPSASAVAISADEDGTTVDGTFVLAGDADSSDDHTFDITSAPSEGSVVNNNDGTFTFDPGSDFQDLADGETRDVTFTYTAIDDSGTGNATSTSATVTVTVTGTNDQPSASAVAISADEDGTTVDGSFVVAGDADTTDSHTFDITSAPAEGSVVNNNDGTFTFDPGSDFQDLVDGETRDVTFTYTAIDDSGTGNATSTSATVTVTVTGTNDQPSASAVAISADEDGATVDGTFVVAGDADTTDSHTFDITSAPSEGSVVNNNDGTFTFDPGSDFQDLADGETRDVTFTYTAIDDSGTGNATSTSATVTGSNDQPSASAVAISADEDGATVDGTFVVAGDADTTDIHTFDITSAPAEGSVVNNNDGTFTFDPGSDFQDLADGETREVSFTYTATDDSGTGNATSASATVTVTVTGSNDQPTAGAVAISADEDGATVDGTFVVAGDADTTDSHTFDITSAPSEGSVVNNNDGTFTFDPGSDFQDLADGETRDVTFTYTAIDDSGTGNATSTSATVTVTVTGTNDQPTAGAVAISADEDGATVDGTFVLAGDADTSDGHTFDITSAPAEGSVVNNNDGTFTFDPGSDFQDLADGETRDVTFTYTAIDDSGTGNATSTSATVTVTVTGSNDQPTAGAIAITADEDGATVDGTFVVAGDADTTDSHTFDITSTPAEGSVVNNNDGTFTFDPGSDFQDLADGETRDVTFTYTAIDDSGTGTATSTSATVTVTVTGTNDQPSASAVAISADEDGATVDGTFVLAGDADTTDNHTFDITSAPSEGSVVNNNDGTFTFDPGSDFQDLADGETRDVTFTYTAIDDSGTGNATSTSATVTVTVTGTNDQPTASAVAISADEDGSTVDGTFVVAGDADTTDTHTFNITSAPSEGSVVNNNDGTFTFDPGTDFQNLADGETRDVTFTYTAIDDSGTGNATSASATVTVTVTGTNDQPSASAVAISADEDGATVDGTFVLAGDADTTDSHTFDITSAPAEGSVVNNNDGTFTFDPGSDFQDLADGETRDVTFTYTAIDDSGTGNATSTAATVTITVTGTNDQPTASAVAISADEDGATVDGTFVLAGDADTTDGHTFDITSAPSEGSVVNNNDGTFTFDPGSDFQDLADGETRDVTFTYTATDDSGTGNATSTSATVTVTVTGTNDQPTAGTVAISADEDGATVDGAFVVAGDADTTDSHTFDITSAPSEGSVVNNNDGTFTFDPGSDFQDLADGETRDVTFTYTAIDDSGTGNATSTSATVTITVTGTNDQPIAGAVAISADEDGATVDGTFVVAGDADTTDSHTFDITSAPGEGSVVNNNDGTFTFNPGSDFQDLADGETRDVTFTYTAIDDSGTGNATSTSATVTVTVTGTNDQPTASAVSISADEDGATVDGTFVVAGDADTTDSHTFDITSAPSEGSVVNNNDGTFTFDPGSDFQDLANGETRDVTFTYTAIDDSGTGNATSTSATVTVTVTGTNDQPSARAVAISVDEDGATVDGIFVLAGDADTTDNHTFDITSAPSEGSVVNNNDGTFTFDPGSDFQDLADGETRDVAFTYTAIDDSGTGNATSTSVTVTVTVTGTNDQPTAGAVAISADEDGATVDGTFVLTGDADTTDTHTFDITSAPAEGSVVNNNDGTFTFDPGSDFQDLADGETRDVTFTYTATDDSGTGNATSTAATVSITVTGTNDQPTAGAVAISADEDGATVDGTFVVAGDADTTDSHTFDITSAPAEGSVVNNNDGTFTFDPGSDFQDLADGETRDVTFTYTVIDNSGTANNVSTSEIVTVTVTGSNDQPQVSALTLSTEVTANSVSGTFNVTDADSSDTHQFLIVSQPAEGILVNNGDGTFTFNLNDEFKDLELGAERSVTFTYIAMDDSGSNNDSANIKTVVITVINNTYVAPTVELPTDTAATNEDTGTGKKPANDTTDDTDSQEEGGPVDQGPTIANETIIVSDLTPTDGGPALAPTIDIDNNTDGLFEAERDGLRELNDKLSVFVPAELAVVESMQKQFMLYNEPLELVKSDNFMRQLDQMREMIDQQTGSRDNLVGSAFGVSAGLTAGYVVWLARSGVLLSSLMSSLPIWRFIDPLPILGGTPVATAQDDETLQSMVASTELSERDAIQEGESQ